MTIPEYCGHTEFSILQFTIHLTEEIHQKIKEKNLFYHEQIIRFTKKRIDHFFQGLQIKEALRSVYKNEVFNTIMIKIKSILKEYQILRCV